MKVDFKLPLRYVVDGDVVTIGVVVALWHDGILRGRRNVCRSAASSLLRCHALWWNEPTGGRQTIGGDCTREGRTLQQLRNTHED